jgi:hypothetical protein
VHQRGMRRVFGVVKVNVRHHAGFLGASAPNELARCCKELVGDRGQLPQPPPRRPVARLAHEAARLPERIGAVVVPRLYVHVVRDDERDGDQLPIATLPAAAEPLVYITRLAQLPPQPTVPLQKSHHVHRAADGVVAGERSGSHLAVGRLKAEGGHLCESDVGAKNSNSDSCCTANQIRTHVRMGRGRKGASETHSQRRGAPSMSGKKSPLPETTLLAQMIEMRLAGSERTAPELLGFRRFVALLVEGHPFPPFVLDEEVEFHAQCQCCVGEIPNARVIPCPCVPAGGTSAAKYRSHRRALLGLARKPCGRGRASSRPLRWGHGERARWQASAACGGPRLLAGETWRYVGSDAYRP